MKRYLMVSDLAVMVLLCCSWTCALCCAEGALPEVARGDERALQARTAPQEGDGGGH